MKLEYTLARKGTKHYTKYKIDGGIDFVVFNLTDEQATALKTLDEAISLELTNASKYTRFPSSPIQYEFELALWETLKGKGIDFSQRDGMPGCFFRSWLSWRVYGKRLLVRSSWGYDI